MKIFAVVLCVIAFNFIEAEELNNFPGEEDYLIVVDKPAAPVEGIGSIYKKIVYPRFAMETKTQGKVYLLILINEKGDVDQVKVVKGIGAGCDEEASKAIQKTKFTPAQNGGVNVPSKLSIAIQFKIDG
jgi:periplasmic protein TonB